MGNLHKAETNKSVSLTRQELQQNSCFEICISLYHLQSKFCSHWNIKVK